MGGAAARRRNALGTGSAPVDGLATARQGRQREDLATVLEAGLALLSAYDRQVEYEEQTYEEVQEHGGFRI